MCITRIKIPIFLLLLSFFFIRLKLISVENSSILSFEQNNSYSIFNYECDDPNAPTSRRFPISWNKMHKKYMRLASYPPSSGCWNAIFLGDSITERWMGTSERSQIILPHYFELFNEHFHDSLALGTSGDTTSDLLKHMQYGLIKKIIKTKTFVILIGTNDVGRMMCSEERTLKEITKVLMYLISNAPTTPIIVHGLLPRNDRSKPLPVNYTLGILWKKIQWINKRIELICSQNQNLFYLDDAKTLFVHQGKIRANLMPDALHPNLEGYRSWAPLIRRKIEEVTGA